MMGVANKRKLYALEQRLQTSKALWDACVCSTPPIGTSIPISAIFSPEDGRHIEPAWLLWRQWLASLVVVVEGWQRLELVDGFINARIKQWKSDGTLKVLVDFRNAVYHFSPDLDDDRLKEVLYIGMADGTVHRLRQLQHALDQYFQNWRQNTDLSGIGLWQVKAS